jgi:hypothetical protein
MTARNPHRLRSSYSKPAHRLSLAVTAAGLVMLFPAQAYASVTPGESFVYDWTETSPVGLTGTADFTLGPASGKAGVFDIAGFSVTQNGGFCSLCSTVSENLSLAFFDSTTGDVTGEITGSFLNQKGRTHTFKLFTTDTGTWTFDDTGPGGVTTTSVGTYKTTAVVSAVDEPAIALLLAPAAVALLIFRRRRNSA